MFKVYCRGNKGRWMEYSQAFLTKKEAEECKRRAEQRCICDRNGNLIEYKVM